MVRISILGMLFFLIVCSLPLHAQQPYNSAYAAPSLASPCDSLPYRRPLFYGKAQKKLDRLTSKEWFKETSVAVPLTVGGVVMEFAKQPFNDLRNAYIPHFRRHYDDYLQYAPAVLLLGLKIGGVKSYSSWGRMLTADAFSVAIMAIVNNGLKYTVKSQRPNSHEKNSFPSGHSATAFMTATMLHEEFGRRSPWYSVAGYTLATVTAYSRLMNNRHWISDVMTGAGIGILSTEMGYWIAGLIFKDKGIQYPAYDYDTRLPDRTPSFFGLNTGFTFMAKTIRIDDALCFTTSTGASTGIEGAWLINNYTGIGGQATASHVPASLQMNKAFGKYLSDEQTGIAGGGFDFLSVSAGGYFVLPLTYRWSVESKLLAGYSFGEPQTLYLTGNDETAQTPFLKIKEIHAPDFQTGLTISYWVKRQMGLRFFFDYTLTPTNYRYYFIDEPDNVIQTHKAFSSYTLGASVNIFL